MKNLLNRLARIALMFLLLVDRTPFLNVYASSTFKLEIDFTDSLVNAGVGQGQYDIHLDPADTDWVLYCSTINTSSTSAQIEACLANFGVTVAGILASASVDYPGYTFNGFSVIKIEYENNGDAKFVGIAALLVAPNLPPVANNDSTSTPEDTAKDINVLANDTDPESDPITVISVSDPANGTTSINGDGTIHYVPDSNFFGVDTFTYTVNGGDTATVTVTVTSVDDLPVANDDTATTDEDTPVDIDVLANDTDVEGDPITVTIFTQPTNGSVSENADGTLKYTPSANFFGSDSFTYTINGGDTATVRVTVNSVNDPGEAVDDTATTEEDTPVDIDVLANDIDVEGNAFVASVTQGTSGSVSINPNGTVKYTPNANFNGSDSFTYTLDTGDTANVSVTVTPVDDLPVAVDDTATTDEDTPVDIDVLANDTDVDGDPITVESFTQPTNGEVTENPDGTLKYTPDADFNGTDSFTYTINGGDTATVTVTVDAVDDNPVAVDDTATTDEDTPVDIDVLANDTDVEGDPITVESFTQPTNGEVTENPDGTLKYTPDADFNGTDSFTYTINGGDTATVTVTVDDVNDAPIANDDTESTDEDTPVDIDVLANDTDLENDPITVESFTQPTNGTVTENPDGTLKYTPDADFNGVDGFTYTINGGSTASVTVTVDAVDDNPVAVDDTATTDEDTPVDIDVLDNDTDVEGDPITVESFTQPTNGEVTENPDGTLKYTPDADFNGTDSFTYTINGGDTASVTVTVDAVDDNPVAVDDTATTDEDTPVDIDVLDNDTDVEGDPITVESFTQPTNGEVTENPDGTLKYTPDADFNGTDSFTYTINGGDTATVTVTVDAVDDNPVAVDDTATTDEDVEVDIDVLDNDTDVDGDPITVESFTQPTNGTVTENPDGTLKYTPDADFNGTDSFTYTINGGDTATVTVTVDAVDDNPVAVDDTATTDEDTPVDIDVLANDTDVEGDPITVESFTQPTNGTVTENLDGTLAYTPDAGFSGTDSFTYTINGGDSATVTITVVADPVVNLPPVAIGQSLTVITGGTLGGTVTATDPENDPLAFSLLTGTANGSLVFNVDGTFTYVHNGGPSTSDSFLFEVYDGTSTSNALVTITITGLPTPPPPPAANIPPVVVNGTLTTDFEDPISGNVSGSDADGDPLVFSLVVGPTNGTLVFNPDGSFTYTPNDGFDGSDSFTFIANDGTDDSNIGTFTINVSEEEIVVVEEEETPLVALPFDWFSWLAYLLAGLLAWLLAFLRPNMKYTLTDGANNQKVIRRRLAKPDEKTMIVELNDKDMVNLQTINVEFYKRLAKHCGDVTVNFQLNGKVIHSVIIPEGIDDSFETLIRL
jgi:VCBS repeat-containing protein